jgi:hypothetical protein
VNRAPTTANTRNDVKYPHLAAPDSYQVPSSQVESDNSRLDSVIKSAKVVLAASGRQTCAARSSWIKTAVIVVNLTRSVTMTAENWSVTARYASVLRTPRAIEEYASIRRENLRQ